MNKMDRAVHPNIYQMDYLVLNALSNSLKKAIEKYEKANLEIVDVGCGGKPYRSFFKDNVRRYIGVDLNAGEYVDCISLAEYLPFRSETFDVAISTQMLEHVKDPRKAIKEIHSSLKKGGVVFLSTHGIWEKHESPNDYWRWTDDGLKISFADFKNVEVIENGGSILCLFQLLNLYVNKLPTVFKPIKIALFLINNLIGKHFDSLKYTEFVINYLVIAEK